jgi:hypothetical protein
VWGGHRELTYKVNGGFAYPETSHMEALGKSANEREETGTTGITNWLIWANCPKQRLEHIIGQNSR